VRGAIPPRCELGHIGGALSEAREAAPAHLTHSRSSASVPSHSIDGCVSLEMNVPFVRQHGGQMQAEDMISCALARGLAILIEG
jgi:hypothetical protein